MEHNNLENESIKGVMVCVTNQRSCERLIMHGAQRSVDDAKRIQADVKGGALPLYVVHCVQTGQNFLNTPYEADAIDYLFTCAQVVDAELTILRCDSVEQALADFARKNNVGVIVMGAAGEGAGKGKFAIRLQELLPEVEFDIIT